MSFLRHVFVALAKLVEGSAHALLLDLRVEDSNDSFLIRRWCLCYLASMGNNNGLDKHSGAEGDMEVSITKPKNRV